MSIQNKFKNWKPQAQRKLLEELLMIHAGTDNDKLLYGQPTQINLAWHDTPESIHRAYWSPVANQNGLDYETLMSNMSLETGTNGMGDVIGNTPTEVIAGIRTQGCWAFTEYASRTVHLWIGTTSDQNMLMQMIASEVGHLTPDRWEDDQLEELRTTQMGNVAQIALQIFNDAMERRATELGG